jgi:hypothetical protein
MLRPRLGQRLKVQLSLMILALHCSPALTDRLWSRCGCNVSWRDKIPRFVRLNGARTRADGIKPWPVEDIDPIEDWTA